MEQDQTGHPSSWWRYQWQSGTAALLCSTPPVAPVDSCSMVNVTCIAELCNPSLSSIYDRSKHQRVRGMRCTPPDCQCHKECRRRMRSPPHVTKHHPWPAGSTNLVGQTPSRSLHSATLLFKQLWCNPEFKKLTSKTWEFQKMSTVIRYQSTRKLCLLAQRSTRNKYFSF